MRARVRPVDIRRGAPFDIIAAPRGGNFDMFRLRGTQDVARPRDENGGRRPLCGRAICFVPAALHAICSARYVFGRFALKRDMRRGTPEPLRRAKETEDAGACAPCRHTVRSAVRYNCRPPGRQFRYVPLARNSRCRATARRDYRPKAKGTKEKRTSKEVAIEP